MVMSVVVTVGIGALGVGIALPRRADFVGEFRFDGTVIYSVFPKFLTHRLFDKGRVAVCHDMKRCNVIEAVKGGNV